MEGMGKGGRGRRRKGRRTKVIDSQVLRYFIEEKNITICYILLYLFYFFSYQHTIVSLYIFSILFPRGHVFFFSAS